jgi:hypothetical protein
VSEGAAPIRSVFGKPPGSGYPMLVSLKQALFVIVDEYEQRDRQTSEEFLAGFIAHAREIRLGFGVPLSRKTS